MSYRYLIWSILSPSQLILGGLLVGALLLAAGRLRAGRWLTVAFGIALLVIGLLPTATYVARPLETRFPKPELPERIAGIILLAGAERPTASEASGEPQVGLHGGRYITLLRLAARYPQAPIVYSGGPRERPGKGRLETPPAVAAEILASIGLLADRVSFEEASRDTCASASNTFSYLRPRSADNWLVVTSAIHVPRTMACFRAVGWNVIPYPADFHSYATGWWSFPTQIARNLDLFDLAAHEWIGLAYYRLSGRTKEIFPAP